MNRMSFKINNVLAIKIKGEFDAHVVAEQRAEFESLAVENKDVVVDISAVHFIDSSGIGVLVFLYKRLVAKGGSLCIVGLSGQPLELFRMLHLDKTLTCFDDLDAYLLSVIPTNETVEKEAGEFEVYHLSSDEQTPQQDVISAQNL
ncbi:MAG: STAS domain-containing protein [Pseudomonadales bacterium]|nr:STAS domain-containing protein [Pseudomonadales bacterium]